MKQRRLAILGSGPTGLEAALAAAERGYDFTLYEAAPRVAGNVASWGHVRLFTPWSMNASPRMRRALTAAGAGPPEDDACPTGAELVANLFAPLAALPQIQPHLRLNSRVRAIGREGLLKHESIGSSERAARPFRLLVTGPGAGEERIEHADLVLDCTGTYGNPNSLGDGGIPAPGETALNARITHALPDFATERPSWVGKKILLAGAGHSAQTAARSLAKLAEEGAALHLVWALRKSAPQFSPTQQDPLVERERLGRESQALVEGASEAIEVRKGVFVDSLREEDGRIAVTLRHHPGGARGTGGAEEVVVDRILSLTGGVPDHSLYRQLQVHECYATCGPMKLAAALLGAGAGDCLAQTSHGAETLTNPEPGFFILGAKSYGRNNTFLMRVGWEQVDEVFGMLERT